MAAPASFEESVRRAGLEHFPWTMRHRIFWVRSSPAFHALSMEDANAVVFREVFCGVDVHAALPRMRILADQWKPDLVLREVAEFASLLVGEDANIPHVQVALSLRSVEAAVRPFVHEPLRTLGLDRGADVLKGVPRLTLVPASVDDDVDMDSASTYRFRFPAGPTDGEPPPQEWWSNIDDPLVYMTFGSVAAGLGFFPDFYRAMLAATAILPVRVLLTVGDAWRSARSRADPRQCARRTLVSPGAGHAGGVGRRGPRRFRDDHARPERRHPAGHDSTLYDGSARERSTDREHRRRYHRPTRA